VRAAAALAALALIASGCASTNVTLLDGEEGADTGSVVVLDPKTSTERGALTAANTKANAASKSVKPKKVKGGVFAFLTNLLPERAATFTLYFKEGTTDLIPESEPELNRLLAEVMRRQGVEVEVTGHTDSVGKEEDNDALSLERARQIRDALVHRGIDLETTSTVGRGERDLLIKTADNVEEPANRRVVVTVR
jgi:outer membrane protein OmpA-like peptidoglycan-associated protein